MVSWNDVVYYDAASPSCLKWKIDIAYSGLFGGSAIKLAAGTDVGSQSDGRWILKYKQKVYKASRVVWELHNLKVPIGFVIDHEDGNPLNNKIGNLRLVTQEINSRNRSKSRNNKTGTCGVSLLVVKDKKYGTFEYYSANWHVNGKMKTKRFSIAKLGRDEAYKAACDYRAKAIEELNGQGAGYTVRHGI